MFTKEFCDLLEYYISTALAKSKDIEARRCWCDGVLMPEDESSCSNEQILTMGIVLTRAWMDEGRIKGEQKGQFIYETTILFGPSALQLISNGDDLNGALPGQNEDNWIKLDLQNKKMEIQLL